MLINSVLEAWEQSILIWLQGFASPFFILINNIFSILGESAVGIIVMGLFYWGIDKRKGEIIGLAVILTSNINPLLKNIVCRTRPFIANKEITCYREVGGYSFPSGHSSTCTALYPSVSYQYKDVKLLKFFAILIPLLCGFSRLVLGVHYLSDVVVGLLLGLAVFFFVSKVAGKFKYLNILLVIFCGIGLFYCQTTDYFDAYGLLIGFVLARAFEKRFVNFENSKVWYVIILRVLGGLIGYLVINNLLKLILVPLFPVGSYAYLLLRAVRYGVTGFILIGIYPMVFKLFNKK